MNAALPGDLPGHLPARPPALLVRGGCVYTADADHDGRMLPVGSVLVVGDTVAAVGTTAEVDAAAEALPAAIREGLRTIDGSRHMVLPGFVNAHWHEMFAMRLPFKGRCATRGTSPTSPASWRGAATPGRSPCSSTTSRTSPTA